jgi:hypothetical protein
MKGLPWPHQCSAAAVHGIERFRRLVPAPAAELLAFLEDRHPAFRGNPRHVFQAAGKGALVGAELLGKAKRRRHLGQKILTFAPQAPELIRP